MKTLRFEKLKALLFGLGLAAELAMAQTSLTRGRLLISANCDLTIRASGKDTSSIAMFSMSFNLPAYSTHLPASAAEQLNLGDSNVIVEVDREALPSQKATVRAFEFLSSGEGLERGESILVNGEGAINPDARINWIASNSGTSIEIKCDDLDFRNFTLFP